MQHQRQAAWVVAILALTGLNGAAQTVTFSDQDFNDSDWTAEIIVNEAGSSAKFEARQDPNRGNPGAFRRIKHEGETKSTGVEIHVAHLRGDAVYDPSESGRITSIDHSYDLKNLESRTVFDSTYYLLIFQNNTYYRSPRDRISRRDWTPFGRSGLETRDFTRVAGDGPRRLNFSDKAPPLQFGFASVSNFPASGGEVSPGLGGDGEDSRNSGIDNWTVSIFGPQQQACRIVSVAPPAIGFGPVLVDAQSPLQTLRVVGSETALLIQANRSHEEFDVLETFERISETELDLFLFFTPFEPGPVEGTITFFDIRDEGIAECSHTVALHGAGIVSLEPRLSVRPSRLSYSFVQQSPAAVRRLLVLNKGGGSASFQVDAAGLSSSPWLSVSPLSGEVTVEAPVTLTVEANPAGLAPDTYLGEIVIATPANAAAQQTCPTCDLVAPVAMAISSRSQLLRLSQRGLTFTGVAGGGAVPVQNLRVFNDGLGVMAWDIGLDTLSGGGWLTATPLTGASEPSVPATVDVAVSTQGLTPGVYYGLLEVAAPDAANSPRFTTVVLNLLEGDRDPGPIVDPRGLIFASTPADPAPSPQSFRISNLTSRSIAFTLQGLTLTGGGWLAPTAAQGIVSPGEPTNIGVEVLLEGLDAGIYRGLLRLQFDGGLTRAVEVLLVVSPEAVTSLKPPNPVSQAGCSRTEVAPVFKVLGGTSSIPAGWPAAIEVEVVDNCANKMTDGSVVVDFASIASPSLALGHAGSGLWTATWNVPAADLPSMATVTVTATDPAGISAALTQALSVSPNSSSPPRIAAGGVVHGASFVVDPLAPGTIVSIFGSNLSSEPASGGGRSASSVPLPTELAGTQMILGGRPLPILFSREDQVNAVLPFEVADRLNESLPLLVRRTDAGSLGVPEPVLVNVARPGVFTRNASGSGPGSIQNANFQIVTLARPVKAGDAIIIYGTGLGAVSPEVASGEPAPASPLARTAEDVTVTIGGRPARVLFAGLTPGFTSLYQVNAVVPAGLPAGEADLVVSIAGQASPVVTLAVE